MKKLTNNEHGVMDYLWKQKGRTFDEMNLFIEMAADYGETELGEIVACLINEHFLTRRPYDGGSSSSIIEVTSTREDYDEFLKKVEQSNL